MPNLETIKAKIVKVIFAAKDSNYKVCYYEQEGEPFDLKCSGNMNVTLDQVYMLTGTYKDDPKYGPAFHVVKAQLPVMDNKDDIIDYLSSDKFERIGRRTARRLYDYFREEILDIIEKSPSLIVEAGFSQEICDALTGGHKNENVQGIVYDYLKSFEVYDFVINNVYDYIESKQIGNFQEILETNPYYFVYHVNGFSFTMADKIFLNQSDNGFLNLNRVKCALCEALKNEAFQTGNTVLDYSNMMRILQMRYKIPNVEKVVLDELLEAGLIYIDGEKITHNDFFKAEFNIAKNLNYRINHIYRQFEVDILQSKIADLEKANNFNYDEIQKNAIVSSLNANVSIIAGGPGTGKTTIIKAVATIYRDLVYSHVEKNEISKKILLCAPTGRASQRMKQATGFSSKTIHSALGWDAHSKKFARDIDNQLEHDLVIIDEFSMVDSVLAETLFRSIKSGSKIIIVGDPAQLESVNPGSVLRDLIDSKKITSTFLKYVFRQGEGSTIIKLANQINYESKLELINTGDMSVIKRSGDLTPLVKKIVEKSYSAGFDELDVQVLYPKYKGINGIDNLNIVLKPEVGSEFCNIGSFVFALGDKVMQMKNNVELDIYNGDIGVISKVFAEDPVKNQVAVEVDFGRIKVQLSAEDCKELVHAYAISIHKSQGSEFKVIILPIAPEANNMLSKKLIYTAITRAKEKLIIIGDMGSFELGTHHNNVERLTLLGELLEMYLQKEEKSPFDFL